MKERPRISFLIGSGFSIPEGLPGVRDLNNRLSKIEADEILVHSDMRAMFLNGQVDHNPHASRTQRLFIQEFLEHYNTNHLDDGEEFHYETFYDFYSHYLTAGENAESIEKFDTEFVERHLGGDEGLGTRYRVSQFNRSFNQLLASELMNPKYFNDITFNGHAYGQLLRFLAKAIETHDVKFHTLNHDLFFDYLGRHSVDLWQHFCDGFQLEGSPFYGYVTVDWAKPGHGRVHKRYRVKLPRFVDRFDRPLALYKLHGSITNIIVHVDGSDPSRVRIKSDYAIGEYEMEVYDQETGEGKFVRLFDDVAPDFLSGTTNKTRYYTDDPYYVRLLEHFKDNLGTSEKLVVIGYGFQDAGINDYLEEHFLSKGKQMIVIDPYPPSSVLMDKYDVVYVPKGVLEVEYDEYLELTSLNP